MKVKKRMDELLELYCFKLNEIAEIVCDYYNININTLKSDSREGLIVKARNFVIYFMQLYLQKFIPLSSTKHRVIALYLMRDRLTIRHHHINISWLISHDKEYIKEYNNLLIKYNTHDFF